MPCFLVYQCPHEGCLTHNISLQVVAVSPLDSDIEGFLHLRCPRCKKPSAAHVEMRSPGLSVSSFSSNSGLSVEVQNSGYVVMQLWPKPPKPLIPEHLPPDIERAYVQAERNFPIAGNEEAAGTMYRKAIDVGLKLIDPTVTGQLRDRIEKLVKSGQLTDSLGEWSHQVRLLGNEAAHEIDQPTREELEALRNFSDLVLRYLFTLPAMVAARKAPAP